jgi:hypothetical protein
MFYEGKKRRYIVESFGSEFKKADGCGTEVRKIYFVQPPRDENGAALISYSMKGVMLNYLRGKRNEYKKIAAKMKKIIKK